MKRLLIVLGIVLLAGAIAIPVVAHDSGWGRGRHMMGPWDDQRGYEYGRGYDRLTEDQRNQLDKLVRDVRGLVNGEGKGVLSGEERAFLIDIAKNPISAVTARYSRLGMNRYQGNKIQMKLIKKGLITFRPVSTKTGRLKVLVLTCKGKEAIRDIKIVKIFKMCISSYINSFCQEWIAIQMPWLN